MNILIRTLLDVPFEKVKAGFNRELFLALAPPWAKAKLIRFDGCKTGDQVHLEMQMLGIKDEWESLITHHSDTPSEWSFIDEGKVLPKPLSNWKHHHRVVRISEQQTEIVDDIHFECRPSFLAPLMFPVLWASFAIRPGRYKAFFKG